MIKSKNNRIKSTRLTKKNIYNKVKTLKGGDPTFEFTTTIIGAIPRYERLKQFKNE